MTFEGVIPALLTPFGEDLEVRADWLGENLAGLKDAGIEHVVVCGTMGEAGALDRDERRLVVETAIAGGVTVSVGVSGSDTRGVLANVEQAVELGAHSVMCTPPTTYDATDSEIRAWYAGVVEAAGEVPVMLYNNPEAAKVDLSPALIASIDGIAGVKECSGDARRIAHILELAPQLDVLIGGDDWALEGYAAGAVGWVSGVANVLPAECVELERLVRGNELEAARRLWPRLAPLSRLDMDPRLVQSFKAALDIKGLHGGPTRPPRLPLEPAAKQLVVSAMNAATVSAGARAAAGAGQPVGPDGSGVGL